MLEDGDGHIDFGEPDASQAIDGDLANVTWFPQESDDTPFWFYKAINAVKIGEEDKLPSGMTSSYKFKLEDNKPVIFNTGVHHTYLPDHGVGLEILRRLTKGRNAKYYSTIGGMVIDCDERDQYEDVSFSLDGKWIQIKAEDYLEEYDGVCYIGLLIGEYPVYTFGTQAMNGYYTIFDNSDPDNARVGFAPHATSTKSVLAEDDLPSDSLWNVYWEHGYLFQVYQNNPDAWWANRAVFKLLSLFNYWFW